MAMPQKFRATVPPTMPTTGAATGAATLPVDEELATVLRVILHRYVSCGASPILLACSGGRDSQVLLHAASSLWPARSLVVGHVHHGLQAEADHWLRFCRTSADRAGLVFRSRHLEAPLRGSIPGGIEAWARRHRYRALAEMAAETGAAWIVTAHHANDQIETMQLRRMRDSARVGPFGLAAMRESSPLPGAPAYRLLRPFLRVARQRLADYAACNAVEWIEDPSNRDLRRTRNGVRLTVAKALAVEPDALMRNLAEIDAAQRAADAIRDQARLDLARCRLDPVAVAADDSRSSADEDAPGADENASLAQVPATSGRTPHTRLSRAALAELPDQRLAEALRCWLAEQGCQMPSRAKLAEVTRQLVAGQSSRAEVSHDGRWLLRHRDQIGAAKSLPPALNPTRFRWNGEASLEIAGYCLRFTPCQGTGVDSAWLAGIDLLLDRGRGCDRIRLAEGRERRSWKNLMQERGVPPWLRQALPLIRAGDDVLFAAPFGMVTRPDLFSPSDWLSTSRQDELAAPTAGCADRALRIVIDWVPPQQWGVW